MFDEDGPVANSESPKSTSEQIRSIGFGRLLLEVGKTLSIMYPSCSLTGGLDGLPTSDYCF